jgi:hydroxyacylglutathione hydrolase
MKFERFVVGMIETNGYIIYDEKTEEALIIDPGDEPKTFIQYIEKNHLKPVGIIFTHYHYDHIGGVEEIKKKYDCPIFIHKKDVEGLKDPNINYSAGSFRKPISIIPDRILREGDKIQAGDVVLEVIHTPGHTHGGICLKVKNEDMVFTGDTIFDVDIGRTDLEGGSYPEMKNSIRNKISKWDDGLMIYPGHGDFASMEYVKRKNIEYLDALGKR